MGNLPEKIIETRGNIVSFGGKSLASNMNRANQAIAKMEYTERIFDRSRSQFTIKNLVASYPSDWKNLRQISAEMQRKRDALREAKFNYAKRLQESEIKKAEIGCKREDALGKEGPHKQKLEAEIVLLEIEVQEINESAEAGVPKIEGALKEILTMEKMHDDLVKRLGDVGEDAFERHEAQSHIKNSFIQAIREFRATARIQTGVQQYMEQCGINITKARADIVGFLNEEATSQSDGTELLYKFLDEMAKKYEPCARKQTELLGFSPDHIAEITYDKNRDAR